MRVLLVAKKNSVGNTISKLWPSKSLADTSEPTLTNMRALLAASVRPTRYFPQTKDFSTGRRRNLLVVIPCAWRTRDHWALQVRQLLSTTVEEIGWDHGRDPTLDKCCCFTPVHYRLRLYFLPLWNEELCREATGSPLAEGDFWSSLRAELQANMPANLFVLIFPRKVQAHTVFVTRRGKPKSKWGSNPQGGFLNRCGVGERDMWEAREAFVELFYSPLVILLRARTTRAIFSGLSRFPP